MSTVYRSTTRIVVAWLVFALFASAWMSTAGNPEFGTPLVLGLLVLAIIALVWALWEHRRPRREGDRR